MASVEKVAYEAINLTFKSEDVFLEKNGLQFEKCLRRTISLIRRL